MADDEALWVELQELMARADPVPAVVLAAARESLAWHDPDAALAALVADSSTVTAGVRGGAPRLLTFAAGPLTLEVEAEQTPTGVRLVGQILPPQPARLRIDQPAGRQQIDADERGRFAVDIRPGQTRMRCAPVAGAEFAPVQTEWVRL